MESDTVDTQLMKGSNGGTIAKVHTMIAIIAKAHVICVVAYTADVSNTNCRLATSSGILTKTYASIFKKKKFSH